MAISNITPFKKSYKSGRLQAALTACNPDAYLPLDCPASLSLLVYDHTPESVLIKKDAWEKLSQSAKDLLLLFADPPADMQLINRAGIDVPRKGEVSLYVHRVWRWTHDRYRRALYELHDYAGTTATPEM
jgi:hypothetical protein